MSLNVDIWKNLISQGVYPPHVLRQANLHLNELNKLDPFTEGLEKEKREVDEFVEELQRIVDCHTGD